RRDRRCKDFTLGYVGRLTPEKNVRLLVDVERALLSSGRSNCRFIIVGEGYERPWLERNLHKAEFTGVLTGEQLARAFSNLDLFLFPSRNDTFGNVVLEALSSGVPAIVTADGGPKYLVRQGVTGLITRDDQEFVESILSLIDSRSVLENMREQARRFACSNSWPAIFDLVYRAYGACLTRELPSGLAAAYAG